MVGPVILGFPESILPGQRQGTVWVAECGLLLLIQSLEVAVRVG